MVERRKQGITPELRRRLSEIGKVLMTSDVRQELSDMVTDERRQKHREVRLGKTHTDDAKKKIGDSQKGEKNNNWQGGISFEPYCVKFNYKFKESVRDKFGRVCFICGKTEEDNDVKLSVHHVNYDKSCLCSEIKCKFVPLCASCHGKTSNGDRRYWENLILEKLVDVSI